MFDAFHPASQIYPHRQFDAEFQELVSSIENTVACSSQSMPMMDWCSMVAVTAKLLSKHVSSSTWTRILMI